MIATIHPLAWICPLFGLTIFALVALVCLRVVGRAAKKTRDELKDQ